MLSLTLVLVLTLSLTLVPVRAAEETDGAAEAWKNPFADVRETDAFYGDVAFVCAEGLFNGTAADAFEPGASMSRAMLAVVLYRLEGRPEGTARPKQVFTDVDPDSWYGPAVAWAAEGGLVKGIGGGLFDPDESVTRQDTAVVLARYTEYTKLPYAVTMQFIEFPDQDKVAGYASNAIQLTNKLGVLLRDADGQIAPTRIATRAELAGMLHRYVLMAKSMWENQDAQNAG
jgi:hypothetical protein